MSEVEQYPSTNKVREKGRQSTVLFDVWKEESSVFVEDWRNSAQPQPYRNCPKAATSIDRAGRSLTVAVRLTRQRFQQHGIECRLNDDRTTCGRNDQRVTGGQRFSPGS